MRATAQQDEKMEHDSDELARLATLLGDLETTCESFESQMSMRLELPEPGLKLDLKSRESVERQFKHLHQSCWCHAENFRRANQIKLPYIIRAYLTSLEAENPLGVFSGARMCLEFHAFLRRVIDGLAAAASGSESAWRDRGMQFFATIVRARFATSNPELRDAL